MGGGKATILCYWNDDISEEGDEKIDYNEGSSQLTKVHTKISFKELVDKIYRMTGWEKGSTEVKITGRLCKHSSPTCFVETLIFNDETLSGFLDSFQDGKVHRIELYLRSARIENKTSEKPTVQYRQSSMTCCLPPDEVGLNPKREIHNQKVLTKPYMSPIQNVFPGPKDPSILVYQKDHRSSDIWETIQKDEKPEDLVRVRCGRVWIPHPNLHRYIMDAGFLGVMQVKFLLIDHSLMTALVERWRPETHTFHFPVGEMTITLEDVAMLLGLPIEGDVVTGGLPFDENADTGSHTEKWADMCMQELGLSPGEKDLKGSSLQLKWLSDNFSELPTEVDNYDANTYSRTLKQYTKAWLLAVLGTVLFPSTSGDIVSLLYLVQLVNLEKVINFSWGSAVLANLYRGLCRATKRGSKELSGCALLLQLWSWERLHIGRPKVDPWLSIVERANRNNGVVVNGDGDIDNVVTLHPDIANSPFSRFPYGRRWIGPKEFGHSPRHALPLYRSELDSQKTDEVKWQPYEDIDPNHVTPLCYAGRSIWRAKVPLICYHVVEWHFPDRVLRQFGLVQGIPSPCDTERRLHMIDKRGRKNTDWGLEHSDYVLIWARRHNRIINADPIEGQPRGWDTYLKWYHQITRRFVARPVVPNQPESSLQYHGKSALWDRLVDTLVQIGRICKSHARVGDRESSTVQGYTEIYSMCLSALKDTGERKRLEISPRPLVVERVEPPSRVSSRPKSRVNEKIEPSSGPSHPRKPRETRVRGVELSNNGNRIGPFQPAQRDCIGPSQSIEVIQSNPLQSPHMNETIEQSSGPPCPRKPRETRVRGVESSHDKNRIDPFRPTQGDCSGPSRPTEVIQSNPLQPLHVREIIEPSYGPARLRKPQETRLGGVELSYGGNRIGPFRPSQGDNTGPSRPTEVIQSRPLQPPHTNEADHIVKAKQPSFSRPTQKPKTVKKLVRKREDSAEEQCGGPVQNKVRRGG